MGGGGGRRPCLPRPSTAPDRLSFAAALPPWARVTMLDPSRPVEEQVGEDTRVLIPATAAAAVVARAAAAAPRLALITQPASGLDNVDVPAAVARGVIVCSAPGVNAASVAEAALMSLLMVARRALAAREACFGGRLLGQPLGVQLAGKTLAVVGAGAVGGRLATAAEALGMTAIRLTSASTPHDLHAALAAAHAVSVHVPLTASTRGLFGEAAFAACRRGCLFVNYSRGAVVDECALLAALNSGHIGGAALDVLVDEPAGWSHPLVSHARVVATPHIGVATEDVANEYVDLLVGNVVAVREKREPRLRVQ